MCEDVVIINHGEAVVRGSVREVKRQHGQNIIHLKFDNDPQAPWLDEIEVVQVLKRRQDYIEVQFPTSYQPNLLLAEALRRGALVSRFEITEPSLTDIFIATVGTPTETSDPALVQA